MKERKSHKTREHEKEDEESRKETVKGKRNLKYLGTEWNVYANMNIHIQTYRFSHSDSGKNEKSLGVLFIFSDFST